MMPKVGFEKEKQVKTRQDGGFGGPAIMPGVHASTLRMLMNWKIREEGCKLPSQGMGRPQRFIFRALLFVSAA
jgi:hypothetical protein